MALRAYPPSTRIATALVALALLPRQVHAFSSFDVVATDVHDDITRAGLAAARLEPRPRGATLKLLDTALQLQDGREMGLPLTHIQSHLANAIRGAIDDAAANLTTYVSAHHFDRRHGDTSADTLGAGRNFAASEYNRAVDLLIRAADTNDDESYGEGVLAFGAALHAWQDAWSHSNVAELVLTGSAHREEYLYLLLELDSDPPASGATAVRLSAGLLDGRPAAVQGSDLFGRLWFTLFEDPPVCVGTRCFERGSEDLTVGPKLGDDCDAKILDGSVPESEYTHLCFNKDKRAGAGTRRPAKQRQRMAFNVAREGAEAITAIAWTALKQDVGESAWTAFTRWHVPQKWSGQARCVFFFTRGNL